MSVTTSQTPLPITNDVCVNSLRRGWYESIMSKLTRRYQRTGRGSTNALFSCPDKKDSNVFLMAGMERSSTVGMRRALLALGQKRRSTISQSSTCFLMMCCTCFSSRTGLIPNGSNYNVRGMEKLVKRRNKSNAKSVHRTVASVALTSQNIKK